MLHDALNAMSDGQDLTGIGVATASTNTLDLGLRELGVSALPLWAIFSVLPTSNTGGATLNATLQTSADNVTWTPLLQTGPQPITNITSTAPMAFRGTVPVGTKRYFRMLYTPSAALTAGTVLAVIGSPPPAGLLYARNYLS